MGDLARARADHATLLTLDRALAAKLERVISRRGDATTDDGVAAQYD